jgi:hypothetical protein
VTGLAEASLAFGGHRLSAELPADVPTGTSLLELEPFNALRFQAPLPLNRFAAWVELVP